MVEEGCSAATVKIKRSIAVLRLDGKEKRGGYDGLRGGAYIGNVREKRSSPSLYP